MNVVITGSTKGIGHGLAHEFAKRGHSVMISGRDEQEVRQVVTALQTEFPAVAVHGQACDVRVESEVQQLWDESRRLFGAVDIWINNAGINNRKQRLDQLPLEDFHRTLTTNLNGMINGSVVALRGMLQQGSGWIYNMEGFGSDGMIGLDQIPYGLSKNALTYFTKALAKTCKGTAVKAGYLQPGIVTTRMAVPPKSQRGEFFKVNKKLLNILADHVETVTPWLVEQMLSATKNGTAIRWMSVPKAAARFLLSPFQKRRVIEEAMARQDAGQPASRC